MDDTTYTPEEHLEAIRRECLAYAAEHYEPTTEDLDDADYVGTNHDMEHIWDQALGRAIGPSEWWERYATDVDTLANSTEAELERYTKVFEAFIAIALTGLKAARDLGHEERLFGEAAESPEVYSPVWTTLFASGFDGGTPEHRVDLIVRNYLLNVRAGLMDATTLLHDLDEV